MSNHRNRGKQSNDDKLFSSKFRPFLVEATNDLCLLLSRGYAQKSALQLVGNRYKLNKRQRNAIMRISCSEQSIKERKKKELKEGQLTDQTLEIDGFNILIFLESLLSGAYIFQCRDGLYRDISSVHGSYKRVHKTEEGVILIGKILNQLKIKSAHWYLDQPVSNSGKLKTLLLELAQRHNFDWTVELVFDPDKVLANSKEIIITSDGWILDKSIQWFNLSAEIINRIKKKENILAI